MPLSFSLGISQLHSTATDNDTQEHEETIVFGDTIPDRLTSQPEPVVSLKDDEIAMTPIAEEDFKRMVEDSENDPDDILRRKYPERKVYNLPLVLRSPYWIKNNSLDSFVSAKEKCISEYAFSETTKEKLGIILWRGKSGLKADKRDFLTMTTESWIIQNILDIWCLKLSTENMRRAVGQPKRVFFSTLLYAQLVMDEREDEHNLKCFNRMIDNELCEMRNLSLEDADLVFFLVLQFEHYWALCINLKTNAVEVLDNIKQPTHTPISANYDNAPVLLANAFLKYCKLKGLKKEEDLIGIEPTVLKMKWRTPNNYNDCGVYCMRHLEMYKGESHTWDAGFSGKEKEDTILLNAFRAKYCTAILMMEENVLKERVVKDARQMIRMKIE